MTTNSCYHTLLSDDISKMAFLKWISHTYAVIENWNGLFWSEPRLIHLKVNGYLGTGRKKAVQYILFSICKNAFFQNQYLKFSYSSSIAEKEVVCCQFSTIFWIFETFYYTYIYFPCSKNKYQQKYIGSLYLRLYLCIR